MTEPVTLAAALAVGLSVGLTACTVSCLPFMGSWVFGRADGGRAGLRDAGAFLAGRVAGYGALGAAAGLAGEALLATIEGGAGHLWIGLAALAAAGLLLLPPKPGRCATASLTSLPPVALGAALALVPCAPLATLVAAAAASGDAARGGSLGLAFGLGAAVTPLLAVLPALGALGRSLRREQPWLGRWLRLGAGLSLLAITGRELLLGVS